MTTILIDPKIAAHVDAALTAGFTVYALPNDTPRPTGFVCLCLTEDGPWAHIQKPTNPWDDVQLDVPIKPSRDYGSGVAVDYNGSINGAVVALTRACSEPNVRVRFFTKPGQADPIVPNLGRKCIEGWPGGTEFVKLGQRGTNWVSRQLAGRLEVGDRFTLERSDEVMTVTDRRYIGEDAVVLTVQELEHPVQLGQRMFVTLAGAA